MSTFGTKALDDVSDKKKQLANKIITNLEGFWKIRGLYIESRLLNFTVAQHLKMSEFIVEFLNKYSNLRDMPFWMKLKHTTKCNVANLFTLKGLFHILFILPVLFLRCCALIWYSVCICPLSLSVTL